MKISNRKGEKHGWRENFHNFVFLKTRKIEIGRLGPTLTFHLSIAGLSWDSGLT